MSVKKIKNVNEIKIIDFEKFKCEIMLFCVLFIKNWL